MWKQAENFLKVILLIDILEERAVKLTFEKISNVLKKMTMTFVSAYGVAMISRLLKILGLFCRISSFYRQKRPVILRRLLIVGTP